MHAPLLKLLLACALLGVSSLRVGPPLPAAAARVRPLTSSTPWRRAHVVLEETDAAADASKAIDEAVDKMKKSVGSVTENLATLRVGRLLLHNPMARLGAAAYAILVHLWLLVVIFSVTPLAPRPLMQHDGVHGHGLADHGHHASVQVDPEHL